MLKKIIKIVALSLFATSSMASDRASLGLAFISDGAMLVDVRTPKEFNSGHLEGAKNIELKTIRNRLSEFSKDDMIVLYCRSGNRSGQAYQILKANGYTDIYNAGGYLEIKQEQALEEKK